MFFCAAKEPACARVVPRAEKNIEGIEEMEERWVDHVFESEDVWAWSLASLDLGSRRDTGWWMLGAEPFSRAEGGHTGMY